MYNIIGKLVWIEIPFGMDMRHKNIRRCACTTTKYTTAALDNDGLIKKKRKKNLNIQQDSL